MNTLLHLKLNSQASESFILTWSSCVPITYFFPCKLRWVQNIFHGKRCFVDERQFGFSWLHFSLQWSAKGTSNQCWCLCLYVLPLRTPPGRFEIYMSFKKIPKWSNASSRNNCTQRPPCEDDLWDPRVLQNVNVRPQGWGGVVWCGVVGQLFIAPDPVKMCLLSFSSCSLSLLGKLLFANRGFSAVRTRTWWLLC